MLYLYTSNVNSLRQDQSDTTQIIIIQLVSLVNASGYGVSPVVEEVIVQLAVARAKLLLLQEETVVHERQGVEDVKLGELGEDEGVVDEVIEAVLEGGLVKGLLESHVGGVVEEVGDTDDVVLGIVDGGRLDAVEGEEVGNVLILILGSEC